MIDDQKFEELFALTKDNNKILRAMRRSAFIGGIIKFIFWIAFLFVIPYFFYQWYLAPYVGQALQTYEQAQTQSSQFNQFTEQFKNPDGSWNFSKAFEQFGSGEGQ